jgi:hypothetical protein
MTPCSVHEVGGILIDAYPKDPNDNKKDYLEKVPLAIVCDLEEY